MIITTPNISSKLPKVGTSIFTKMSALSHQYGALNLSQGFPDFEVDKELIALVTKYMKEGANQYAPMQGVLALRQAIGEKINASYGLSYDPYEEITITAGATQAIYTAIAAFVKENDEVIIFTPAYDCYDPAIELHGGKTKYVALKSPDYAIDWEEVKKTVSRKTRMIIINTPHNPTGKVLKKEDLQMLEKITEGSDIIVLSDEVYEHIVFDDMAHESVCKYSALAQRSLAVFSFGKTFHATGWKMGYCIGPQILMSEFRKVHQFNVFSCNQAIQLALAEYLVNKEKYNTLPFFYQKKRDLFLDAIADSAFDIIPSSGTYFQLLGYSTISDESDVDFAVRLTREYGIASIPISVFYQSRLDEKMLRFCFAKQKGTLKKAAEIINSIH